MKGIYRRALALAANHSWDTTYGFIDKPAWKGVLESILHEMAHAQLLGAPTAPSNWRMGMKGVLAISDRIRSMPDDVADRHEALTLATEHYAMCALGVRAIPMIELVANANFRRHPIDWRDLYSTALRDPRARRAAAAIVKRFEQTPA